jgi:hypothetical protein
MTHILLCTPYRPSIHPALLERWKANAEALAAAPGHASVTEISALLMPFDGGSEIDDGRFSAHARSRNAVLDAINLDDYDYLYWIDADIVAWPSGLLSWALTHNPEGVSAPAVTLDRCGDRFYDILGYLEDGVGARMFTPWFNQGGRIVTLESVGCCYVIPAAVYRGGARYQDTPGATEHLSVMAAASGQGRPILANLGLRAIHAYLPDYGEALH